MKKFCKTVLFFLLFANIVFAQNTTVEKAIELYKQGDYKSAITVLESLSKQKDTKRDFKVWNYLGLTYIETNNLKKARKALEKADNLSPQNSAVKTNLGYAYLLSRKINNAQTQLNEAITIEPRNFLAYYIRGTSFLWERKFEQALTDAEKSIEFQKNFTSAYILKADVLTAKFGQNIANGSTPQAEIGFLRQAIEGLENCVKNCQNVNLEQPKERLESLKSFYEYFSRTKTDNAELNSAADVNAVPTAQADSKPLKILTLPRPSYTDKARQNGIGGTITLYVLFGANGKILNIIQLSGLGYGLDEQAAAAARKITFEPKTENGKPVSVVKKVMFSFTIY